MKILITAGGTKEPIDPVRYIGNRSSGKMGRALFDEALIKYKAEVIFLDASLGSAQELYDEVLEHFANIDVLIMAAAVADYTLANPSVGKIKKSSTKLSLELTPTVDILKELGKIKTHQFLVGFCLESENLKSEAQRKLLDKKLDMIIANGTETLGSDQSRSIIITKHKEIELPLLRKEVVAEKILSEIMASCAST